MRYMKVLLAGIFIPVLIYFLMVLIGAAIPVNSDPKIDNPDIEIYLISNGLHIDIAVPFQTKFYDWSQIVEPQHSLSNIETSNYVSFGWGILPGEVCFWNKCSLKVSFARFNSSVSRVRESTFAERSSSFSDGPVQETEMAKIPVNIIFFIRNYL